MPMLFFPIERRAYLVGPRICAISETKLSIDYSGKKKKVMIVSIFPAFSVPLHGSLILGHATNMYVAIFNKSNL